MADVKILEDVNNKLGKHTMKNEYWKWLGVKVERVGLPVADYILVDDKVQDVLDRKAERGIKVKKMDLLGTYNVAVDIKNSVGELAIDICGKDHQRFRDELILAQNNGIKLYILVENEFEVIDIKRDIVNEVISKLEDLHRWRNKRAFIIDKKTGKSKYPRATRGVTLMKACMTLERKYGCKFIFCSKEKAGAYVLKLLGVNEI